MTENTNPAREALSRAVNRAVTDGAPPIVEQPTYDALLARARAMGEDHGRAAASWYFDGTTAEETYAAVLAGLDEGNPDILDSLPSSPLSGEWADDPTSASVLAELDVSEDDDAADDYLRAYEDGFYDASAQAIEETARKMAPVLDSAFDVESAYAVEGYAGIAWRVDVAYLTHVEAHMIGDDRTFRFDRDELTPVGDDDYCGGCGQIGCQH